MQRAVTAILLRRTSVVAWLLLAIVPLATRAEEEANARVVWRPYSEGPLRAGDFQATIPAKRQAEGIRLEAFTVTDVRYETRFALRGSDQQWSAWITEFNASASVDRSRSWNAQPEDPVLLDHEQGHFDLSHAWALDLQQHIERQMKQPRAIQASGRSSEEAQKNLEARLRSIVQPYFEGHVRAQEEYDRTTQHGLLRAAQSEQRRNHAAQIAGHSRTLTELRASPTKDRGKKDRDREPVNSGRE